MDHFLYESRLLGLRVVLTPFLLILGLTFFAVILRVTNAEVERFFTAGLEIILPLATGLLMTTITTRDPAVELQLTMPHTYRTTVWRRFTITLAWTALMALIFTCLLWAFKLLFLPNQITAWSQPEQLLASQFIWFATLIWFGVTGFCLAQLTRSMTASASLLSAIWLVALTVFALPLQFPDWFKKTFFLFLSTLTPRADYWLLNRALVLVVAVVLFFLGSLLLFNTEGLLKTASEE